MLASRRLRVLSARSVCSRLYAPSVLRPQSRSKSAIAKAAAALSSQSRSQSAVGASQAKQQQPWVVLPSTPDFEARAADAVLKHGFVIIPELFAEDGLAALEKPVMEQANMIDSQLHEKSVALRVGSANGFHQICLRSPGRKDFPCSTGLIADSVVSPLDKIASNVFAENAEKEEGKAIGGAANNAVRGFFGMVRGEPGCPAQLWHTDSPHITGPDHGLPNMLNMVVSLEDCLAEMGPTELIPQSHILTNHFRAGIAFNADTLVYQNPENSPELIGSTAAPVISAMPAGSAVIFDDRIMHRGGHNQSTRNRDIVFFSYHRSGYSPPAYYEAKRSLATYNHKSLAETVRKEFPGLARCSGGNVILADGASGSQFHNTVIEGMVEQMSNGIANMGGNYDSSRHAERTMVGMRAAMADFLNCASDEIVVGASMSALTYHVARALRNSDLLKPGDNIVLDPMSHGSNVWTWVQLAKACGVEVRWFQIGDGLTLNSQPDVLSTLIDEKTKFISVGYASNAVGSVHDVKAICAAAEELSKGQALRYVDAVHYAPHGPVDVQDISCDLLVCSPYKFFGPHSGILFGRKHLLQTLSVDRLDCQDDGLPAEINCHMSRWEVGTQNYEAAAGITAAVDYLADLGGRFGGASVGSSRADRLNCAWHAIGAHESELKLCFLEGSARVRGLHLLGVTDPAQEMKRTATFAVAKDGFTPEELTAALCERGVWCTSGNHYAGFWNGHSGGVAGNDSGLTRLGFLHYNTINEIEEALRVLADL